MYKTKPVFYVSIIEKENITEIYNEKQKRI